MNVFKKCCGNAEEAETRDSGRGTGEGKSELGLERQVEIEQESQGLFSYLL